MKITAISDPQKILDKLRHLHDACIVGATYDVNGRRIEFELENISWNLYGVDGLPSEPCTLIFSDVSAFSIAAGQDKFHSSIVADEPAIISEAYAITKGGITRFDIVMTTSEHWYVEYATMAARTEVDFS